MDGLPFKAGLFSQALRRRCFNEHLGFLATDDDNYEEPLEPVDSSDEHGDRVADVCSSDFFEDIWLKTATVNTDTYEKVFRCVPSDKVTLSTEIRKFQEDRLLDSDVQESRELLKNISGTLVHLPLKFLEGEELTPRGLNPEAVLKIVDTFL